MRSNYPYPTSLTLNSLNYRELASRPVSLDVSGKYLLNIFDLLD